MVNGLVALMQIPSFFQKLHIGAKQEDLVVEEGGGRGGRNNQNVIHIFDGTDLIILFVFLIILLSLRPGSHLWFSSKLRKLRPLQLLLTQRFSTEIQNQISMFVTVVGT